MYPFENNSRPMNFQRVIPGENGESDTLFFNNGDNASAYWYKAAWLTPDLLFNMLEDGKQSFGCSNFLNVTNDELLTLATYDPTTTRNERIAKVLREIQELERQGVVRLGRNQMTDAAAAKGAILVKAISCDSIAIAFAGLMEEQAAGRAMSRAESTASSIYDRLIPVASFAPDELQKAWTAWQATLTPKAELGPNSKGLQKPNFK